MKFLIPGVFFCIGCVWFVANAETEYIFPTPFSEAHCRWKNKTGQTVHVYEGQRSPGYVVENEQQCGLAVRTLALGIHGVWASFDTFDGELEFRPEPGISVRCETRTVNFQRRYDDGPIQDYKGAARQQMATLTQLEAMRPLLDRYIQVTCGPNLMF